MLQTDLKLVITDCDINKKEQLFYKAEAAPVKTFTLSVFIENVPAGRHTVKEVKYPLELLFCK